MVAPWERPKGKIVENTKPVNENVSSGGVKKRVVNATTRVSTTDGEPTHEALNTVVDIKTSSTSTTTPSISPNTKPSPAPTIPKTNEGGKRRLTTPLEDVEHHPVEMDVTSAQSGHPDVEIQDAMTNSVIGAVPDIAIPNDDNTQDVRDSRPVMVSKKRKIMSQNIDRTTNDSILIKAPESRRRVAEHNKRNVKVGNHALSNISMDSSYEPGFDEHFHRAFTMSDTRTNNPNNFHYYERDLGMVPEQMHRAGNHYVNTPVMRDHSVLSNRTLNHDVEAAPISIYRPRTKVNRRQRFF